MQVIMNNKQYEVILTISELANENKDINANSISNKLGISWHTAKKYLNNLLNIKGDKK